jgi:hypothetical protein
VTTDQLLAGLGLIAVLAVGSQVLASRLRILALTVLLPVGFVRPSERVQRIIGLLFITISATVTPASLRDLILPTVAGADMIMNHASSLAARMDAARSASPDGARAAGSGLLACWAPAAGVGAARHR